MKCFVCKSTGQVNVLMRGTVEKTRCPHCQPVSYLFLTQPSLRQGSAFFETMINKPGFNFIGADKINNATVAVELGTSGKRISNLYFRYAFREYGSGIISSLTAKEARGRGELISVVGNYMRKLVIGKMVEAQKKEVSNSNLTKEQKEYILGMISDGSLRNIRLASGNAAYTLAV